MRLDYKVRFAPSPMGPRRVYGELLALLLVASWESLPLGQIPGLPWGSRAVADTITFGQLAMTLVVFLWLNLLVIGRTPRSVGVGRWWGLRLSAVAVGMATVAGAVPVGDVAPYPQAGRAAFVGALVWLTLEVCRRHGITAFRLGVWPLWPKAPSEQTRAVKVGGQALIAVIIGGVGAGTLTLLMQRADLPLVPSGSQQDALGITSFGEAAIDLLRASVMEDLVMVAAVVALLSAARRPAWEMYTITCFAEVAVHAYMGLPALMFLPYAWLRVRIFRRHGMLVPLIAAHLLWNAIGILGWFFTVWQLLIPLVWVTFLLLAADGVYRLVRGPLKRGNAAAVTEKRAER